MSDYCDALNQIEAKLHQDHKEVPFRIVVIKNGQLIAEWNNRLNAETGLRVNSVKKSIIALTLGIAVADGTIQSIDDRVYDYSPWIIDVEEGAGPKPTVYATEKDREITFRQIAPHFSGYMKVDEPPGGRFHYQTYSLNLLANVIASLYSRYDPVAHWLPGNQGIGSLIGEWISEEIGANWDWRYGALAGINQSDKLGIFREQQLRVYQRAGFCTPRLAAGCKRKLVRPPDHTSRLDLRMHQRVCPPERKISGESVRIRSPLLGQLGRQLMAKPSE